MNLFSRRGKSTTSSVEVAAATLMFRCECRFDRMDFSEVDDSLFDNVCSLARLTKVGFVLLYLDTAAQDLRYQTRALALKQTCEIVFDPDFANGVNPEEVKRVTAFLIKAGGNAFTLVDLLTSGAADDPEYFQRLSSWSRGWLSLLGGDSEIVANRYGLHLAAIMSAELAELRPLLKQELGVESTEAP